VLVSSFHDSRESLALECCHGHGEERGGWEEEVDWICLRMWLGKKHSMMPRFDAWDYSTECAEKHVFVCVEGRVREEEIQR